MVFEWMQEFVKSGKIYKISFIFIETEKFWKDNSISLCYEEGLGRHQVINTIPLSPLFISFGWSKPTFNILIK